MHMEQRLQQFVQLSAIAIVMIGCYQILLAFLPAILLAIVITLSSWPLYVRLRRALRGRATLAALAMESLLIVLVIAPLTLLAFSFKNNAADIVFAAKALLNNGPIQPPEWLKETPVIGAQLNDYWQELAAGGDDATALFKGLLAPAKDFIFISGKAFAQSLIQMTFAVVIGFFFFRDGDAMAKMLKTGLEKIAGVTTSTELLETIRNTVVMVVHGIFGTALGQAMAALIGFLIAGVPGALLLSVATFFLSIVPIGPPLIWGGATFWLFTHDSIGWAIFMAMWGFFVISAIDDLIKPYIISQGSGLPLLLIILGIFGGIVAVGFIGIFIGPPLLAVGLILVRLWAAPSIPGNQLPRKSSSS